MDDVLPLLDLRSRKAFEAGHAPGAVNLPAPELDARTAELPPRSSAFLVMAESPDASERAAQDLVARGFRGARAAPVELQEDRGETGPARSALWRPTDWLADIQRFLPRRGRALEVATGAGRNAVALALRGFTVWGFDLLLDAVERASTLARAARGASSFETDPGPRSEGSIAFCVADATQPLPFRPHAFDLILGTRFLDRALLVRIVDHLAPGGLLVWETFTTDQPRFGRPTHPGHLLEPGELASLCARAGLVVEAGREAIASQGPALASIAARKPFA